MLEWIKKDKINAMCGQNLEDESSTLSAILGPPFILIMAREDGPSENMYPLNLITDQHHPLKPLADRHPHLFKRFDLTVANVMQEGDPKKAVSWIVNKPTAVIATDELLATYMVHSQLGLRLREYVKRGGTLILMGGPTWHDDYHALDRLYEEFNLPWRVGKHYFNEYDMVLNERCPLSTKCQTLPSRYKTHGRLLNNVRLSEAVYVDIPTDIRYYPYPHPPPYPSTCPGSDIPPDLFILRSWPAPPNTPVPVDSQTSLPYPTCETMMAWHPYGNGHVGYVGECGFRNAKLQFRQEAIYVGKVVCQNV